MTSSELPERRGDRGCVGVVVSGRQIGSRERLFLAIALGLARRGWSVDLLAAGPERPLREAVAPPLGLTGPELPPAGGCLRGALRAALRGWG